MPPISPERIAHAWEAELNLQDICDIEIKKSGAGKVTFNHSRAAEACLSKFPVVYGISYPNHSEGLRYWDGCSYDHCPESILRVILDDLAGNAVNRAKANLMFDLMRHKLLVLPRVDLPERNGRFLMIHRREQLGTET
jgi:hypothetical protein